MTSRIEAAFANARAADRGILGVFVSAGDPDRATSEAILDALVEARVDLVELGMPFSDPMADGPAIQAASLRALKAGMTLSGTLEIAKAFRDRHPDTPLVLMGYYNPIYIYGVEAFLADAADAGVDGLIIVDLPPEEDDELCLPARAAGLDFIRLVTPTSDAERLPVVLGTASGFVYYVAITGITGTRSAAADSISAAYSRISAVTDLPSSPGSASGRRNRLVRPCCRMAPSSDPPLSISLPTIWQLTGGTPEIVQNCRICRRSCTWRCRQGSKIDELDHECGAAEDQGACHHQ